MSSPSFSIPVPSQPLIPPIPGTEQTKQIVFAPSTEPAFVTVPQNSFGEPFVLNPSTWSLVVEAEGVLLVRPCAPPAVGASAAPWGRVSQASHLSHLSS